MTTISADTSLSQDASTQGSANRGSSTRANENSSRRQQILQCLARMLETSPSTRITTAALAKEVGVSEAALYRHFPSKTRMYEGLIDFIEDTLFTRIRGILDDEQGTAERCYRMLSLLLAFADKNPGITRILTSEALTGETERLHQRVAQLYDRLETQLKQVLREGEMRENLQTVLPVPVAAELMLALAEGRIRQYVRSGFNRSPLGGWSDQWRILTEGFFRQPFAQAL